MRIIYPDNIKKELKSLEPFLEFNGEEFQVKSDAPEGTQERYDAVRKKMHDFEEQDDGFSSPVFPCGG